jgi:bacillithiol biosynthesis cysteine-adding enzyme BshC
MECHCLRFSELPHTTKLFAAFVEDSRRVAQFYPHEPDEAGVLAAAREVRLSPEVRRSVVSVLREQSRGFGADAETERSLARLEKGAVAVVTGQQVGLFSGPAYSFYKALSAVVWARHLTERGVDAVPVFWLATEDHDLAEVNHCFWSSRNGLERLELAPDEDAAGRRVGEVLLGQPVTALIKTAIDTLEGPFRDQVDRALQESYRPEETLGLAFGKLLARLLPRRGIVLLDPLDPRLHRLAAGIYRQALEQSEELARELIARSKLLDRSSYHAQVRVTQQSTLLFLNDDGKRRPLRRRNGKFSAAGASYTAGELLAAIEKSPEAFSANVLLRPIVQDSLLPTAAYIGGPAEVAYMAQAEVVYRRLLGRMPAILPRASFTLVESTVARLMTKYGIELRDVLCGRQHLRSRMEQKFLSKALAKKFAGDEKALRRLLRGLHRPLGILDKTLLGALDTAERKIVYQFQKLRGKASRAENFRTGLLDRHERVLVDSLYPHHGLQERTLCLLPFLALLGPALLERLEERAAPAAAQHQALFL